MQDSGIEVLFMGKNFLRLLNGLWVYGIIFLLYFLACYPISLVARKLEKRWR